LAGSCVTKNATAGDARNTAVVYSGQQDAVMAGRFHHFASLHKQMAQGVGWSTKIRLSRLTDGFSDTRAFTNILKISISIWSLNNEHSELKVEVECIRWLYCQVLSIWLAE
jgi:hypothetical protein